MKEYLERYYSDGSWGYEWDDEEKLAAGLEIVAVEEPHEFNFWDRVGDSPKDSFYGESPVYWDRIAALGDEKERCEAAANFCALDRLANDESPLVRAAVAASASYCWWDGLKKLMNDESVLVRLGAASCRYDWVLDILEDDEDETVRYTVEHNQLPPGSEYESDMKYLAKLRGEHTVPVAPY